MGWGAGRGMVTMAGRIDLHRVGIGRRRVDVRARERVVGRARRDALGNGITALPACRSRCRRLLLALGLASSLWRHFLWGRALPTHNRRGGHQAASVRARIRGCIARGVKHSRNGACGRGGGRASGPSRQVRASLMRGRSGVTHRAGCDARGAWSQLASTASAQSTNENEALDRRIKWWVNARRGNDTWINL